MIATLEPVIRAGDLFESLQPESESGKNRKFEAKKSSALDKIVRGFEKSLEVKIGFYAPWNDEEYNKIEHEYAPKACRADEIRKFCVILSDYQEAYDFRKISGLYLSAIINKSKDNNIEVITSHLCVTPSFIGTMNNGKNIHVIGDTGDYLGFRMMEGKMQVSESSRNKTGLLMRGGEILVARNAGMDLGEQMEGGRIIVYKNAGESVGNQMFGGEIIVNGNCNRGGIGDNMRRGKISVYGNVIDVGFGMKGGEIHLFGNYKRIFSVETDRGNVKNGNIYHKGKPIVLNGRRVSQ